MIEQIFNRRYHLEQRLGEGGTAVVWAGMDALLRRRVAVKVLRAQYAGDAEFVRRFYHEAESAARLSHPNVVSIYDVGREAETYYIVMEVVIGSSLAQRIEADGPLSERLVVDVGLQICSGLGYAHRQGILHRDIKPANILVTADNIVKISDFGIARAVERQTMVMTQQGHFLGSVAYLSPEQAQDHELKPTSDLYSLGIVLYELLTGRPPFSGETPIALALKHLSETPPPLPLEITPALAAIVMRLLRKEPSERYASADELASALRAIRDQVAAAPKQLSVLERTTILPQLEIPNPPPRPSPLPDHPTTEKRSKQWLFWVIAVVAALLFGFAVYYFTEKPLHALRNTPVAIPSLLGATVPEAEQTLKAAGLTPRILIGSSETVAAEHIMAEDPAGGGQATPGSVITLTVSNGLPIVEVPNVVAFSSDDAKRLLADQHILAKIVTRYDAKISKDTVISQNPVAHAKLHEHATVTIVVSNGAQPILMPNLVSMNVDTARINLKKLGLDLVVSEQTASDAIAAGTIASQDPAAGVQAPVGSTVSVVVSAGAAMVSVPSLSALRAGDARAALQGVGLVQKVSYSVQSGATEGTVIGQNPGEGSSVRQGTTVEVVVAVSGVVPDVSNLTLDAARAALTDAGYIVGNVAETQEGADGRVARTEPAAGVALRPGESVEIYENIAGADPQVTPN